MSINIHIIIYRLLKLHLKAQWKMVGPPHTSRHLFQKWTLMLLVVSSAVLFIFCNFFFDVANLNKPI
jgi:hypothetical protein